MNETIGQFPATTAGHRQRAARADDRRPTAPRCFDLTAAITDWEVEPGKVVKAWTYNGMVPGPLITVDVGDHVRGRAPQRPARRPPTSTSTASNVPFAMDGVAPITQDPIEPGESFTYDFTADEMPMGMYHAHHMAQMTVPNGMFGVFQVGELPLPAGRTIGGEAVPADVEISQEIPMVLNDAGVIGSHSTARASRPRPRSWRKRGDWIEVNYFNEGMQIHPMHLHQFPQIVIAKDGYPLDHPYTADTITVAPGERYTVLVQLDERRHLGLALPHPQPRRAGHRDVRHGHRARRRVNTQRTILLIVLGPGGGAVRSVHRRGS